MNIYEHKLFEFFVDDFESIVLKQYLFNPFDNNKQTYILEYSLYYRDVIEVIEMAYRFSIMLSVFFALALSISFLDYHREIFGFIRNSYLKDYL